MGRREERIGELITMGLSALEADAIASVEAGEPQADIARRRGISKQVVNRARRNGLAKLPRTGQR